MAGDHTTRRAVLGALAGTPVFAGTIGAAIAGIDPAHAAPADRSAWDRAFRAYEEAKAEDAAFNAVFEPMWEQYDRERAAVPHITLRPDPYSGRRVPVTTADRMFVHEARKLVGEVEAGRTKLDPIPSLQEHLQLCRDVAAAADERDAKIAAIRDRLGLDEAEDRWEALGERAYEAEWALMDMPAPDGAALLWKLEKLLDVERDGGTAGWSGEAVAQTMADARRLLSDGRA